MDFIVPKFRFTVWEIVSIRIIGTKKAIIEAFWQLLEEKLYSKITVQSIVERCQVNKSTFYYYFRDIPALAECSIQERAESLMWYLNEISQHIT